MPRVFHNSPWADAFFGSPLGTKHNMNFWQPQSVYFLENYIGLSELVAFAQNWDIFSDQNGPKVGPHESEFWLFSTTKIQTVRAEKVDGKMGSFV